MSAATRAKRIQRRTDEVTEPAASGVSDQPDFQLPLEATRITSTERGAMRDTEMTPLMRAVCDGQAGTVQALLDRGANVNAKRSDGLNALALAAFYGHAQVVWLLLENGADLTATGRSETPPEMWADTKGFLDIGNILRDAHAARQAEVSPRTTVIDEPERFPRAAKIKNLQIAGLSSDVESSAPDEAVDPKSAVVPLAPVAEESTARTIEATTDLSPSDEFEDEETLVRPRVSRALPEILDPPPLQAPAFNPGSVFVARITSSRKNLVTFGLGVLFLCSGISALLVPQIRTIQTQRQVDTATGMLAVPNNAGARPEANVGDRVETVTPSAPESALATAPVSNGNQQIVADKRVGAILGRQSPDVSGKGSAGIAKGSENRVHLKLTSSSSRATDIVQRGARSTSPSAATVEKQQTSSAASVKQPTDVEEQPKPAPLTVEPSRSRTVLSTPVRSASERSGSQPPPLSIISNKPKPKVIQWP